MGRKIQILLFLCFQFLFFSVLADSKQQHCLISSEPHFVADYEKSVNTSDKDIEFKDAVGKGVEIFSSVSRKRNNHTNHFLYIRLAANPAKYSVLHACYSFSFYEWQLKKRPLYISYRSLII